MNWDNADRLVVSAELVESCWLVYRYEEEGHLHFERRVFIKHQHGEQVTRERLREQVEAEVYDFRPALYRAIPTDRMVDFEVKGEVVLS